LVAGLELLFSRATTCRISRSPPGGRGRRWRGGSCRGPVPQGQATAFVFGKAPSARLEALAVGDAGQRSCSARRCRGFQHAALTHMAQERRRVSASSWSRTSQSLTPGRRLRLVLQQQDGRQLQRPGPAARRAWPAHGLAVMAEQAVDRLPVRRVISTALPPCGHARVQQGGPFRLIGQQQQTQRFDRRTSGLLRA
jgi:hypothetical protein